MYQQKSTLRMAATRFRWATIQTSLSIHYRQTKTLIKKTYLLLLRKWISTIVRALFIPVAVMVFLSYAKHLFFPHQSYGLGRPAPIRPLKDTIDGKLVFVRESMGPMADVYINRLIANEGLAAKDTMTVNSQKDIPSVCPMNLQGTSSCFAAVVYYAPFRAYTQFNTSSGRFQLSRQTRNANVFYYVILVNPSLSSGNIDIEGHDSPIQSHIFPLQWAIDKSAAPSVFTESSRPREWGYSRTTPHQQDQFINQAYLRGVARYIYPAFFISIIGVLYHLPGLFVAEREIGITSLLAAHGCTTSARYLSWHISLSALYFPGWLIGSAFFAAKLFRSSNPAVIIIFQILGGLSMVSFALFLSAFFRRAQLASVFSATVSMLLATVPVILTFNKGYTQSKSNIFFILSALFPPVNYISFLSCFAGWEAGSTRIDLMKNLNEVLEPLGTRDDIPIGGPAAIKGVVYWAFAVMHIIVFPILATMVEWAFFSVRTGGRRVPLKASMAFRNTTPLGIKLTGFSRNYGKVKAVNNLDLEVYKGEIMCLLGTNGSGKTTTLQAIAGIGGVDGGKIEIAGLGGNGGTLSGVGVCPQGNVCYSNYCGLFRRLLTFYRFCGIR